MHGDEFTSIKKRLIAGCIGVICVLLAGGSGYYVLGHGDWPLSDCLYMTAITISTVGFSEVLDISGVPGARLYTGFLIVFGMGIIVYFGSTVVALIVEGEIKNYFRRKKMEKRIARLAGHVIVCGAGATGMFIIKELIATRTPFVAIDESEDRIRRVSEEEEAEFFHIVGNAADDHILLEAGIRDARGLIAALPEDKDNLFLVISARQLNPDLRIVSRGIEPTIADKLKRVGANAVVSPNFIGGMRMASEMIRPRVVEFLDVMLRDKDKNMRVEEVEIGPEAPCLNRMLGQADIGGLADVQVLAIKDLNGDYAYNPAPDSVLSQGLTLIVLGPVSEVARLRAALGKG